MARRTAEKRLFDQLPPEEQEFGIKRLSLNLSSEAYEELAELAKIKRASMTEVMKLALGLARVAIREARVGNKLIVTNAEGKAIKELVMP